MSKPTVAEVFALAGHPVPDGARIVAHFLILPGGTASDVNRYWSYRIICDIGHFLDNQWQVDRINEDDPTDITRVITAVSINLANLPAKDAWDALPEVVKEHPVVVAAMEGEDGL
jgi:hypothetical protein